MTENKNIPFGRPWIGDDDRKAVLEVLNTPILTHGPEGKAFETEFSAFLGEGANSVTVSSCMAALHLSYLYLGIGPGDEVIVPAQTHTATVHAVEWVGAKPVFVDADPRTGNLTAEGIRAAITPRTKAVSVVHFIGIPCDMPSIMEVCAGRGLKVIEDCALALGTRHGGKHAGLFGDVGCFSFYPVKHITTGEGGMFVTKHKEIAEGVARLRAFGVDRTHSERKLPGMYEVPTLGLNYRMSEMQAALGRTQLRKIGENLTTRRKNFEALKARLASLKDVSVLDAVGDGAVNSHYCLVAVFEKGLGRRRDEIVTRLNAEGVGTSVYYPHPVPRMLYYRKKYGYDEKASPQAARISDNGVALPVGPHISKDDVDYIAKRLEKILGEIQ